MEMWRVMLRAGFPKHPDYYSIEATKFGHRAFYAKLPVWIIHY